MMIQMMAQMIQMILLPMLIQICQLTLHLLQSDKQFLTLVETELLEQSLYVLAFTIVSVVAMDALTLEILTISVWKSLLKL